MASLWQSWADKLNAGVFKYFAEAVLYTPAGGEAVEIPAIWTETAVGTAMLGVGTDAIDAELHLLTADVPSPKEGDTAQRVKDGRTMRVVPPIRPDGEGVIVCTLEKV